MKKVLTTLLVFALLWANISPAQNQQATKSLTVVVTGHTAVLSWVASTTVGVTSYNVYRSTTSGSGYVKVGSVAAPTITYTDSTVIAGKTYFYVITAVAPGHGESGFSNQVTAIVPTS